MTSVSLPSVVHIDSWGFENCGQLISFSAPKLSKIGGGCFSYCSKLKSIYCNVEAGKFKCTHRICIDRKQCPICTKDIKNCLERGKLDHLNKTLQKAEDIQRQILVQVGNTLKMNWRAVEQLKQGDANRTLGEYLKGVSAELKKSLTQFLKQAKITLKEAEQAKEG